MTDNYTTEGTKLPDSKFVEQNVPLSPKLNRLEKLFKLEALTIEGDVLYFISDSRDRIISSHKVMSKNKYNSVKIFCGAQELTLEQLEKL